MRRSGNYLQPKHNLHRDHNSVLGVVNNGGSVPVEKVQKVLNKLVLHLEDVKSYAEKLTLEIQHIQRYLSKRVRKDVKLNVNRQ